MSVFSIFSKNIKGYLLGGSVLVLSLGACQNNYLELTPVNTISDAAAFSTPEKILSQVRSLYSRFSSESFYGGRYLVFNEQRGDEFSQNDGNNSTGANVWNQSISGSGDFVNAVWNAAYLTINYSNILIDNLETTSVIDEATRNRYIGEAKFIRAISYFSLVQTYARPYAQNSEGTGLPLRLKGETSGGNNDFGFSPVSAVYTQILKDLDDAETFLPESYADALSGISRARKAAAIALKTRVYLVKGDYQKVVQEAAKIVSSSAPYSYKSGGTELNLEGDLSVLFSGNYTGNEAIFYIPFALPSEAPGLQSSLAANYLSPVIYFNTNGIIADPVFGETSTDKRKNLIRENASGQKLLNKFPKNAAPFTDYIPVIRYAEVILNYAEAAAQTGDLATSLNLLKAVRNRSDANYSYIGDTANAAFLIAAIETERRIELVGEGFRTHDLFRKVLPLPGKVGNAGTAPEIKPAAENYVWAIPSNELAYNKLAPR